VDASCPGSGDNGGKNDLRSYSGSITIGSNALVSATGPAGSNPGTNNLASCSGITNNGIVSPADANGADNFGLCSPVAPDPIFTSSPCQQSRPAINNPAITALGKTGLILTYPNPFNGSTTISYALASEEKVIIKVYSVSGNEIATLQNGRQQAGVHNLEWNGSAYPGGIYIVKMIAGSYSGVNKLVSLK
jgi:hypothetical protein